MQKSTNMVDFLLPASFRIEVSGFLDEKISDYLGEFTIRNKTLKNKTTTSCLTGEVLDQAALIGILNLLYDLRFPILSVEILDKENVSNMNSRDSKEK